MDLIKIGKFIAQLRKEHAMTQDQLGAEIGVTNKTVSRWETGAYLPPAEALMALSKLFDVSVNEILSGRRLQEESYRAAAEANLTDAVRASSFSRKEKEEYYRRKWLRDHAAILIGIGFALAALAVSGLVLKMPLLTACAVLLTVPAHGWRHNTMMAYVEALAFDGSGS